MQKMKIRWLKLGEQVEGQTEEAGTVIGLWFWDVVNIHKLFCGTFTVCIPDSKNQVFYHVAIGAVVAPAGLSPPAAVVMEVWWHITHL